VTIHQKVQPEIFEIAQKFWLNSVVKQRGTFFFSMVALERLFRTQRYRFPGQKNFSKTLSRDAFAPKWCKPYHRVESCRVTGRFSVAFHKLIHCFVENLTEAKRNLLRPGTNRATNLATFRRSLL
jgi:hypothetical protein